METYKVFQEIVTEMWLPCAVLFLVWTVGRIHDKLNEVMKILNFHFPLTKE